MARTVSQPALWARLPQKNYPWEPPGCTNEIMTMRTPYWTPASVDRTAVGPWPRRPPGSHRSMCSREVGGHGAVPPAHLPGRRRQAGLRARREGQRHPGLLQRRLWRRRGADSPRTGQGRGRAGSRRRRRAHPGGHRPGVTDEARRQRTPGRRAAPERRVPDSRNASNIGGRRGAARGRTGARRHGDHGHRHRPPHPHRGQRRPLAPGRAPVGAREPGQDMARGAGHPPGHHRRYVPVGARTFHVESTRGLAAGDRSSFTAPAPAPGSAPSAWTASRRAGDG